MAPTRAPSALLLRSLQIATQERRSPYGLAARCLSQGSLAAADAPSFYRNPDPTTVHVPRLEKKLSRAGRPPVGSRRRRAALAQSPLMPFDELPYQCFQEARKILIDDRAEKLHKIETERARIARLREVDPGTFPGGDLYKQKRLASMQAELDRLKILADINDPNVKRRFEDGKGDMTKPIYRFLADRQWREYRRKILVQRITQMKVVPDIIPNVDPILDVNIAFGKKRVSAGDFVEASVSERPCQVTLQSFDRGDKLVTIAVVDPDVPNLETDSFTSRCHYLASNIIISPTQPRVDLAQLSGESQVLVPWLPPHAQKGSPYHRLALVVLQHKDNIPIDLDIAKRKVQRDGFSVRSFMSRHLLTPISASLFRAQWDDSTAAVMARAGLEGADIQLKRKKVEPLPYKRRNPSSFR